MLARADDRRVTIDEFYARYADQKAELVDGRVELMSGAGQRHNEIAMNIAAELHRAFRGGPCRVYGSDMGVKTGADSIRYPDVTIVCDPRDLGGDRLTRRELLHPTVLFEVASPSTERGDKIDKAAEYKLLPSVNMIVLVYPRTQQLETFERVSEREWRNITHLPGAPLVLNDPAVTIQAEAIFA